MKNQMIPIPEKSPKIYFKIPNEVRLTTDPWSSNKNFHSYWFGNPERFDGSTRKAILEDWSNLKFLKRNGWRMKTSS